MNVVLCQFEVNSISHKCTLVENDLEKGLIFINPDGPVEAVELAELDSPCESKSLTDPMILMRDLRLCDDSTTIFLGSVEANFSTDFHSSSHSVSLIINPN